MRITTVTSDGQSLNIKYDEELPIDIEQAVFINKGKKAFVAELIAKSKKQIQISVPFLPDYGMYGLHLILSDNSTVSLNFSEATKSELSDELSNSWKISNNFEFWLQSKRPSISKARREVVFLDYKAKDGNVEIRLPKRVNFVNPQLHFKNTSSDETKEIIWPAKFTEGKISFNFEDFPSEMGDKWFLLINDEKINYRIYNPQMIFYKDEAKRIVDKIRNKTNEGTLSYFYFTKNNRLALHTVSDTYYKLHSLPDENQVDVESLNNPISTSEHEVDFEIQNVILPPTLNFGQQNDQKRELYYRQYDIEHKGKMTSLVDFNTYLNVLSLKKWSMYTNAKRYFLSLKVSGKFTLSVEHMVLESNVTTVQMKGIQSAIKEISEVKIDDIFKRNAMNQQSQDTHLVWKKELYDYNLPQTTTINIPVTAYGFESEVVGFRIIGSAQFESGSWHAIVEKTDIRTVNIALNTTTFKKENFILNNIDKVQKHIFDTKSHKSGLNNLGNHHFYMNIIDNGRTLDVEKINNDHVRVYGNPNVGGAGGFSRGMIEILNNQKNKVFNATHVLFMDDDVEVLPESFKRTFALLSILKEQFKDRFISGAMLDQLNGITQYEDTGFVSHNSDIGYFPTKTRYNLTNIKSVLRNEMEYIVDNQYGAWWYLVAPMKFINENSMSLPIFYRGDDIEFSLRNKAQFITLNGLAVWHQPFYTKKSKALENYLVSRNSFIDQSINGFLEGVNFLDKYTALFKKEQRMFNYGAADQVLDAFDDYLRGPEYIASLGGIETLKRESLKNEIFSKDIPEKIKNRLDTADEIQLLNAADQKVFLDSDNGHKLPDYALNRFDDNLENVVIINHETLENPGKQFMHKRLAVYDTYNKTYTMRTRDYSKYEANEKRFAELVAKFEKEGKKIEAAYRAAAPKFHSVDFWKQQLGL